MSGIVTTMLQGGTVPPEASDSGQDGDSGEKSMNDERGKKIDGVFYPKKERQIDSLGFEVSNHALHFHGDGWDKVLSNSRDALTSEFITGAACATDEPEKNIKDVRFLVSSNYLDVKFTVRHNIHATTKEMQKSLAGFDWKAFKQIYTKTHQGKEKGNAAKDAGNSGAYPVSKNDAPSGNQKKPTNDDNFASAFRSHFGKKDSPENEEKKGDNTSAEKSEKKSNGSQPPSSQKRLSTAGLHSMKKGSAYDSSNENEGTQNGKKETESLLGHPRSHLLRHHHVEKDGTAGARRAAEQLSEYGRANVGPDGIDFPEKGKDMDEEPEMISNQRTTSIVVVRFA